MQIIPFDQVPDEHLERLKSEAASQGKDLNDYLITYDKGKVALEEKPGKVATALAGAGEGVLPTAAAILTPAAIGAAGGPTGALAGLGFGGAAALATAFGQEKLLPDSIRHKIELARAANPKTFTTANVASGLIGGRPPIKQIGQLLTRTAPEGTLASLAKTGAQQMGAQAGMDVASQMLDAGTINPLNENVSLKSAITRAPLGLLFSQPHAGTRALTTTGEGIGSWVRGKINSLRPVSQLTGGQTAEDIISPNTRPMEDRAMDYLKFRNDNPDMPLDQAREQLVKIGVPQSFNPAIKSYKGFDKWAQQYADQAALRQQAEPKNASELYDLINSGAADAELPKGPITKYFQAGIEAKIPKDILVQNVGVPADQLMARLEQLKQADIPNKVEALNQPEALQERDIYTKADQVGELKKYQKAVGTLQDQLKSAVDDVKNGKLSGLSEAEQQDAKLRLVQAHNDLKAANAIGIQKFARMWKPFQTFDADVQTLIGTSEAPKQLTDTDVIQLGKGNIPRTDLPTPLPADEPAPVGPLNKQGGAPNPQDVAVAELQRIANKTGQPVPEPTIPKAAAVPEPVVPVQQATVVKPEVVTPKPAAPETVESLTAKIKEIGNQYDIAFKAQNLKRMNQLYQQRKELITQRDALLPKPEGGAYPLPEPVGGPRVVPAEPTGKVPVAQPNAPVAPVVKKGPSKVAPGIKVIREAPVTQQTTANPEPAPAPRQLTSLENLQANRDNVADMLKNSKLSAAEKASMQARLAELDAAIAKESGNLTIAQPAGKVEPTTANVAKPKKATDPAILETWKINLEKMLSTGVEKGGQITATRRKQIEKRLAEVNSQLSAGKQPPPTTANAPFEGAASKPSVSPETSTKKPGPNDLGITPQPLVNEAGLRKVLGYLPSKIGELYDFASRGTIEGVKQEALRKDPAEGGYLFRGRLQSLIQDINSTYNSQAAEYMHAKGLSKGSQKVIEENLHRSADMAYNHEPLLPMSPQEEAAWAHIRNGIASGIIESANRGGPGVETAAGYRERRAGNNWVPAYNLSQKARKVLIGDITGANGVKRDALLADFANRYQQAYGGTFEEGLRQAENFIKADRSWIVQRGTPMSDVLTKAQGMGLPRSWRGNMVDALFRDAMKEAAGLAFYTHIQSDPIASRILGVPDNGWGQMHPDNVTFADGTPVKPVANEKGSWANAIGDELSAFVHGNNDSINRLASMWSAFNLGLKTKIRDLYNDFPVAAELAHATEMRYYPQAMLKALTSVEAYKAGALRLGQGANMINPEDIQGFMNAVSGALRTVSGANAIENFNQKTAFEFGKLVGSARLRANDQAFLEKYGGSDWSTKTRDQLLNDIGVEFERRIHGSYTIFDLPKWALRGRQATSPGQTAAKLTFSLFKYTLARGNNWRDTVWKAAENGNPKPLLRSILATLLTKEALDKTIEYLTGNKAQESSIVEMARSGGQDMAYSILNKLNAFAYAGPVVSAAAFGVTAYHGGQPEAYEYPAMTFAKSAVERVVQAAQANRQGRNILELLAELPIQFLEDNWQILRMTHLEPDVHNMMVRYKPFKDTGQREEVIWERLEGRMPAFGDQSPNVFLPSYKINHARTMEEAQSWLPELVKQGVARNAPVEISPAGGIRNPTDYGADFYNFLNQIQGPNAGNQAMSRDIQQEMFNEQKKALAEGAQGLVMPQVINNYLERQRSIKPLFDAFGY